jgi:GT2 family glycosyltransferase
MDYSITILTFNSERYIRKCLVSLVESFNDLSASYEIFVIDNGSKDKSKEITRDVISEYSANINLIEFDHNTGTTFSRNQGLAKSTGEFIIVMDSDAYANPEAIKVLTQYLKENPVCGLAVPKLIYPDGRFQMSTDVFPTFVRKLQRFLFLKKMEQASPQVVSQNQQVDYAISAFWMFPQSVLQKVGLLDEKIFYSPEDVDYCIRIWKSKNSIDYLPSVSIVHDAQEISRSKGFKINMFTLSHIKGLFYLFLKHRYFFSGKKFVSGVKNDA